MRHTTRLRAALAAGALGLLLVAAAGAAAQAAETPTHPAVDQVAGAASGALQALGREIAVLYQRLAEAPRPLPLRLALILCGLALVSAGWRMSHTALVVVGFAAGAALITLYLTRGGSAATFAALCLGGIVGAGMSVFVFYVAVFALGFYAGAALTLLVSTAVGLTPVTLLGLLAGGLGGGALLLALRGPLLIALAAAAGGLMLSFGLGLGLHWAALFALAGLLAQAALSAVYPSAPRPAYGGSE